jgi:hypothetical protein
MRARAGYESTADQRCLRPRLRWPESIHHPGIVVVLELDQVVGGVGEHDRQVLFDGTFEGLLVGWTQLS